jgi:hypothetical protein
MNRFGQDTFSFRRARVVKRLLRGMNRIRIDDDKYWIVMASKQACRVVTSGGNCALRLWCELDFVGKEHRSNESSESKNV